jgi:hypothetical protein
MRILKFTFLVIIILTSCKQNIEKEFDMKSLPTEWVKLTQTDTGLIVFNSCDGGNLLLTITNKDNNIGLFMHGQQEDYTFEILKAIQTESDTVKINTKCTNSEDLIELKFFWIDKTNGLAKLISKSTNGIASDETFVTADRQKDFPTVNQPCRECWSDECDEFTENDSIYSADSTQTK